jgi:hypothetical protein
MPADVCQTADSGNHGATLGGSVLMGGGTDVDSAFKWQVFAGNVTARAIKATRFFFVEPCHDCL